MPLVMIYYDKDLLVCSIGTILSQILTTDEVAKCLAKNLDPNNLTAKDVEVLVRPYGPDDKTNGYAFTVDVLTSKTPERIKNKASATAQLRKLCEKKLKSFCGGEVLKKGSKVYVWVKFTTDDEFQEFKV